MIYLVAFILLESFIAFILYPLKSGKNYYQLIGTEERVFKYHPILGYSLCHNVVYHNLPHFVDVRTGDDGFVFTDKIPEKAIFCLGGSTTMGCESRHDKTYPAILDSLVKKQGYRCINAGVGGYRSIHELLSFKYKILPHKPAMLIIFSGYNDFEDFAHTYSKPYNQFYHCLSHSLSGSKLFKYSALFHILKRLYYKTFGKMRLETVSKKTRDRMIAALTNNKWLDEWKDNIGQIVNLCRENNIKCYLLATVSFAYKATHEEKELSGMKEIFDIFYNFSNLINKSAQEIGNFIDIDFIHSKERFKFFVDRMHFSEEGNKILAELIYKKIGGDLC